MNKTISPHLQNILKSTLIIMLILSTYHNTIANDDYYLSDTELSESCTSEITFENDGCRTVEIYLNYYGNYYHYQTLHPGEQYQQETYEHYLWEAYTVVNDNHVYITSHTAGCEDAHVTINSGGGDIHVDAGNDQTICLGGSVELCATGADHYEWSTGETGACITVSPNNDENYTVTGTSNGCTDTDEVAVWISGNIHVDAGNNQTICQGESVQLCATGANHYEWSNGSTSTCITVSPNSDQDYTVTGTTGGCEDTDHVTVNVGNIHVDAGDDQTICKGESVQLCASGADHYEWSNGSTSTCITISPNNDKDYTVTGTTGGCQDTDHISVHVNKARWSHVDKGQDADCGSCNGSIIVDADYSVTGEFEVEYTYNGATVTEGPFTESGDITLDYLCTGTYSDITIVGVHTGCRDIWSHDIVINGGGDIHVDAGEDQTICAGESVELCAAGADHYEWSNGHTGECITVSPDSDQTYTVTGTTDGCEDTDHVTVNVGNIHVDAGNDQTICQGESVQLCASGADHYEWSNGSTSTCIIVSPNSNQDYTVTGTTGGCENTDHVTVNVGNIHIDAGNDQTICQGESVQLCASGADHYEWSNGSTSTCITVSPNSNQDYTVTGTTGGCEDTDHVTVNVGNIHVDAGQDQTICAGGSVQLCATGADHYEWSNGHTGECITVSPNSDQDYTVTGTAGGCQDTDHVTVNIGSIHVNADDDQTICAGESVQICATGADHYEWSNGHTGACITVSPHQDTNYTVTGTSGGCTDTDHVNIHVNDAEWEHVNKGNDASCNSCDGSIIVDPYYNVTGKFNVSYTYDGQTYEEGPFTSSGDITLDHLCAGTYTQIKIIGVNTGCEEEWPHDIVIGGGDNLHVDAGNDQTICQGESVQLCASGADHYEWSNGSTNTCITVSPNSDQNYTVTGTTSGCEDTDHVSVHVDNIKWDHIDKVHDASCGSCDGTIDIGYEATEEFKVTYKYNGQTYEQGPFIDGNNIIIDQLCAGIYTDIRIIGIDSGCSDEWTDDIVISSDGSIHVDAGDDQTICQGESVQICATGADHYEWSNGHTGACITVSPHQDTNYTVTGTSGGCTDTDHVSVHVNDCSQNCEDYTLDFNDGIDWVEGNTWAAYDLDGQTVDIDILDYDHIFKNSKENQSGLRVNVNPNTKHDEIDIVYTLSEVSNHVVFDIANLDYKTSDPKQQEKVTVYGLLGNDQTIIMPNITSLDGSVAINNNHATATANTADGHDESVLIEFTECIDQVVIIYGSGPDAPNNPGYSNIKIGKRYGFMTKVCPDECESGYPREDETTIADVSIFPNPATTSLVTLSIETSITGSADIFMMDALGRTVRQLPIELTNTTSQYQLDIDGLSAGIYFATLVTKEGRSKAQRLVILNQ